MRVQVFKKSFRSTTEEIGAALNEALEVLHSKGWCKCQESRFSLRLCIEEALVNAKIHGNKNEAGSIVELEITEDGAMCRIRVSDEGCGFDPNLVEMPDCDELGGRGVCLIKHFMEELRFDKDCNCLEMAFRRGGLAREEVSDVQ